MIAGKINLQKNGLLCVKKMKKNMMVHLLCMIIPQINICGILSKYLIIIQKLKDIKYVLSKQKKKLQDYLYYLNGKTKLNLNLENIFAKKEEITLINLFFLQDM